MDAPPARPIDHAVLPVLDLATTHNRLTKLDFTIAPEGHHVPYERRGNRLIVQPAPGQGALFVFEEEQ